MLGLFRKRDLCRICDKSDSHPTPFLNGMKGSCLHFQRLLVRGTFQPQQKPRREGFVSRIPLFNIPFISDLSSFFFFKGILSTHVIVVECVPPLPHFSRVHLRFKKIVLLRPYRKSGKHSHFER